MITSALRQKIHELVDEANDHQLNTLLEVLTPSNSRYTQEEIDSFYKRVKLFEQSGSNGSSVSDTHAKIRSKYNQKYCS